MSSYTKLDKLGEVRLDLLTLLTLLANSSLMAKFFSIKISRVDNFYHRMPHCLELGTSKLNALKSSQRRGSIGLC